MDRAQRIARQHAQTSRLMGVDMLPVRKAEGSGAETHDHDQDRGLLSNESLRSIPLQERESRSAGTRTASEQPQAVPAARLVEIKSEPVISEVLAMPDYASLDPRRKKAQQKLDEIRERYEREAPHKNFVTDHHSIVFGEGDPCARLMFIGEAPGAEEDKVGRPFVGRAGQLLDKMIVALGLRREDVYIANVLKTRPPNNATPTSDEAAACAPYLYDQIEAVRPEVIVTLGLPAARIILNSMDSMGSLRGKWWTFHPSAKLLHSKADFEVPVMPTYHPAFLLRAYTKENRQKVWSDLCMAADKLGITLPKRAAGE